MPQSLPGEEKIDFLSPASRNSPALLEPGSFFSPEFLLFREKTHSPLFFGYLINLTV
jgi:hypothetical protein